MESRVKIFADGGNRLTKIMEESRKPFDFPTIISEPERIELRIELTSTFQTGITMQNSILTRFGNNHDGVSMGKMLVGKAAEEKGLLIWIGTGIREGHG